MSHSTLMRPSAWIPLAMSFAALGTVVGHLAMFGHAPEVDEGTAAHLFQLLIALQIPVVAFFAAKWVKRRPVPALMVLGMQVLAMAAACAPVWYFEL